MRCNQSQKCLGSESCNLQLIPRSSSQRSWCLGNQSRDQLFPTVPRRLPRDLCFPMCFVKFTFTTPTRPFSPHVFREAHLFDLFQHGELYDNSRQQACPIFVYHHVVNIVFAKAKQFRICRCVLRSLTLSSFAFLPSSSVTARNAVGTATFSSVTAGKRLNSSGAPLKKFTIVFTSVDFPAPVPPSSMMLKDRVSTDAFLLPL